MGAGISLAVQRAIKGEPVSGTASHYNVPVDSFCSGVVQAMISPQLLDVLRCPLAPTVRLDQAEDVLVCQRCRLRFPVKEGIPCMIPEEAVLPAGVAALDALPCQKKPEPQSQLPGALS
jgi:uncharacterized protein YbaR (Trm112 family)